MPPTYEIFEIVIALDNFTAVCEMNNGGCSHICQEGSDGKAQCLCPGNVPLLPDEKTCGSK